jgi:hypothetical protein
VRRLFSRCSSPCTAMSAFSSIACKPGEHTLIKQMPRICICTRLPVLHTVMWGCCSPEPVQAVRRAEPTTISLLT